MKTSIENTPRNNNHSFAAQDTLATPKLPDLHYTLEHKATLETLRKQLAADEHALLLTPADGVHETLDNSPEAIKQTVLMLGREILPPELSRLHETPPAINTPLTPEQVATQSVARYIRDNDGIIAPPDFGDIILLGQAWDATGQDPDVERIFADATDFLEDRSLRDDIAAAYLNAKSTGEQFTEHYRIARSRKAFEELNQERANDDLMARQALHYDIGDASYDPALLAPSDEAHERLVSEKMMVFSFQSAERTPAHPDESVIKLSPEELTRLQAQSQQRIGTPAVHHSTEVTAAGAIDMRYLLDD